MSQSEPIPKLKDKGINAVDLMAWDFTKPHVAECVQFLEDHFTAPVLMVVVLRTASKFGFSKQDAYRAMDALIWVREFRDGKLWAIPSSKKSPQVPE